MPSTPPAGGLVISSSVRFTTALLSAPNCEPAGPVGLLRLKSTVRVTLVTVLSKTSTSKVRFVSPGLKVSTPLVPR